MSERLGLLLLLRRDGDDVGVAQRRTSIAICVCVLDPRRERKDDAQEAALVRRGRAVGVDVLPELDAPLERAVLDLHLLVPRSGSIGRSRTPETVNDRPATRTSMDVGIGAGQLEHDVECGRVVGAEAVALRPVAAAHSGEARHLPHVREQLLDLALEVVEVPASSCHLSPLPVLGYGERMVARLVRIVLGSLGLALYVWFAAVRSLPRVRARKRARRRSRTSSRP